MYDEYNDFHEGSDTEEDDEDENERPYTSTPQSMPFKFINGKDGMGKPIKISPFPIFIVDDVA